MPHAGQGAEEDRMDENEHRERHKMLHHALDELVADYISQTTGLPSQTTVMQLIEWSFEQTMQPTGTFVKAAEASD